MPKKPSIKTAKKKAWDAFSRYIRTRDCIATTGWEDEGECITCKRQYPFKQLQAGHFIPGRLNAVLFQESGVHAQCYGCNVMKGGNTVKYWLEMESRYGREAIDQLIAQSETTVKYTVDDFKEIEQKYKDKLANKDWEDSWMNKLNDLQT